MAQLPHRARGRGSSRQIKALVKAILANSLLVLASIAVALVAGEAFLRMTGFNFQYHPEAIQLGWADPRILQDIYRFDRSLLWVSKDYSPRLEYYGRLRPAMVFMGDSCTQFGTYDRSFAQQYLRHRGSPLRYANFGAGGWSSYQGLAQLRRDILGLRPQVITYYYGWNDHWRSWSVEDRHVAAIYAMVCPIPWLEASHLSQLLSKSLFVALTKTPPPNRVPADQFENNLTQFVTLSRAQGILPVLLTAPTSHEIGKEPAYLGEKWLRDLSELVPMHQRYVSIVREVAHRENAPLCDLAGVFSRIPSWQKTDLFMTDGIHLTEKGNERIGEELFSCFARQGLLDSLRQPPPPVLPNARRLLFPNSDFEQGDLTHWQATGEAFTTQPVFADNPLYRGRDSASHRGLFWIGTFERRLRPPDLAAGEIQMDLPQGELVSEEFPIAGRRIMFLMGAGNATRETAVCLEVEGHEEICSFGEGIESNREGMHQVIWNVSAWEKKTARIRIRDGASDDWGHINVDDFHY